MELGNLLDAAAPLLAKIDGPVSAGLPAKNLNLERSQNFNLYGQTVGVKGDLDASIQIHPVGQAVPVAGGFYAPAAGQAFAEALISGSIFIESEGQVNAGGGVSLGFSARSDLNVKYRHVLAAAGTALQSQTLQSLITSSRLPQMIEPANVAAGQLQSLEFDSYVDLGITAGYGLVRQFQTDIFGDLRVPVALGINAAVNASFGLGLSGSMAFTVERISNLSGNANWVRAIVHKKRESRLSLAAKLDLEINYDLGTGLLGLLDQVLDLEPVKQFFAELDEVKVMLQDVASGQGLQTLQQKLGEKATAVLSVYLDQGVDKVFTYLDTDDGRKVLGQLVKVNQAYQNLDAEIQDLWNRVLAYGNLQQGSSFANALAKIAAIDPNNLDQSLQGLLGQDAQQAVAALQDLTGRTLEELIIGEDSQVKVWLERAVALAKQMKSFIDDYPADVAARVKAFAQKIGVDGTMRWLNANLPADGNMATLQANIKDKAGVLLQEKVQALIDKGFAQINPETISQIQGFATKLVGYIDQIDEKTAQLKTVIGNLKGTTGLSLGFEWERIVTRTALVDISFDPTDAGVLTAYSRLTSGNVQGFLAALPDDTSHYALHDSLLTYSKTISTSFSLSFAALMGVKNTRRRNYASAVRLVQESDGSKERRGSYTGSFTNMITESGKPWEASVALTAQTSAANGNFALPYDHTNLDVILTVSRSDDQTSPTELAGLLQLMDDLGFDDIYDRVNPAEIPANTGTRLALSFDLRLGSIDALVNLNDKAKTILAFLNAGYLWHNTPLAMRAPDGFKGGDLAWYIANDAGYRKNFPQPVKLNGLPVEGPNEEMLGTVNLWPSLKYVADARWQANKEFQDMGKALAATRENPTDQALLGLMKQFADYARDLTATGDWTSPMFAVFWPLTVIQQVQPALLKGIRAAGTFRWQVDGVWQTPVFLSYRNGLALPQHVI